MPRSFELDPRTRRVHAVAEDGDCFPFIYYIFRHMTEYIASIWYFKLYTYMYTLCTVCQKSTPQKFGSHDLV